jgi:hypothetical protein
VFQVFSFLPHEPEPDFQVLSQAEFRLEELKGKQGDILTSLVVLQILIFFDPL